MVKYSKTKDFGAKMRKTRKLGKKMFRLVATSKFKKIAKTRAEFLRGKGKLARVVKITQGGKSMYGVYSHGSGTGYRKRVKRIFK
mgnify:CR=1 FL=1